MDAINKRIQKCQTGNKFMTLIVDNYERDLNVNNVDEKYYTVISHTIFKTNRFYKNKFKNKFKCGCGNCSRFFNYCSQCITLYSMFQVEIELNTKYL